MPEIPDAPRAHTREPEQDGQRDISALPVSELTDAELEPLLGSVAAHEKMSRESARATRGHLAAPVYVYGDRRTAVDAWKVMAANGRADLARDREYARRNAAATEREIAEVRQENIARMERAQDRAAEALARDVQRDLALNSAGAIVDRPTTAERIEAQRADQERDRSRQP